MSNICKRRWHKTECENQNENQVFNNPQVYTNTERKNNAQSLATVSTCSANNLNNNSAVFLQTSA